MILHNTRIHNQLIYITDINHLKMALKISLEKFIFSEFSLMNWIIFLMMLKVMKAIIVLE